MAAFIPKWLVCALCSNTLVYSITQRENEKYENQLVSVRPCGCEEV